MSFLSRPDTRSADALLPPLRRALFTLRLLVTNVQKAGEESCGDRLRFGRVRPFRCRRANPAEFGRGLRPGFRISNLECQRRLR